MQGRTASGERHLNSGVTAGETAILQTMSNIKHATELLQAGVAFPTAIHGGICDQLNAAGFRNLGPINDWDGVGHHASALFYAEHKGSFRNVYSSSDGYNIDVDFEHKAFFETYSGD